MAAKASPEASEIRRRGRQRLIGAIALVMVLVVVVPMVLDSEPKAPRNEPSLDMPSKDTAPSLPAPPAAKASVAPEPRLAAPAPSAAATPAAPPDAKVLSSTPPKAPAPAPDPAKHAAPALEGFAVQVGAFRDEARLAQARQKLALAGIVHYTERLDAQGGTLTRLRAGPFPTREAAEAALAKVKRTSLDGKIVSLP